MSIAMMTEPRIKHVEVTDETITARLVDGRVISVPIVWSWRLADATPAQRANWQLIGGGNGVHWPDIDEDLSAEGMLTGVPARRRMMTGSPARPAAGKPRQPMMTRERGAKYRTRTKRRR